MEGTQGLVSGQRKRSGQMSVGKEGPRRKRKPSLGVESYHSEGEGDILLKDLR